MAGEADPHPLTGVPDACTDSRGHSERLHAGSSLAVPDGHAVVPVAQALIPHYDLVVATQDWHPLDHGSFAANHPGQKPGELIRLNGLDQVLWPTHYVQNTPGADFVKGLTHQKLDAIFVKGTDPEVDSYSGFFDNGRRKSTGLESWLKQQGVMAVTVLGVATDYCVKFTALDAISCGFETTLIEDGVRAVDLSPGDGERAIEAMRSAGVRIRQSATVTT